jgi:hypothetical protein
VAFTDNPRVFINCPFDRAYKPLFDAILFTLYQLGRRPCHALNREDGAGLRLPRIHAQMKSCAVSIHDLSRVSLSGKRRLPRFNMPFEAGMAYALHADGQGARRHQLLVLDAKAWQVSVSLSDLAGLDPKIHANKPIRAIHAVRAFFAQTYPDIRFRDSRVIKRRYVSFVRALPRMARENNLSATGLRAWDSVADLQYVMAGWIRENE